MGESMPVAVVSLNDDGKTMTLTFTYAEDPTFSSSNDTLGTFKLNDEPDSSPDWVDISLHDANRWAGDVKLKQSYITKVIFEPIFSRARPVSTSHWFDAMESLDVIEGIQYLNTDSVKSMSYMFYGCRNRESIDVSHLNTSSVVSMRHMFSFAGI